VKPRANGKAGARSRGLIGRSRVTSKGQATIPAPVRKRLGIRGGDSVVFTESSSGGIYLRKASPLDLEYLDALGKTLTEWSSKHDAAAYDDL
jgi:AbrB family looped-hinge helix DNA binding protein